MILQLGSPPSGPAVWLLGTLGCSHFTCSHFVGMVLGEKFTAANSIWPPSASDWGQLADHRSLSVFKIIHASLK